MDSVTVIKHPLVQHKLTFMRKKDTSTAGFRRLLREISTLLCYEVTRDLELTMEKIETPLEEIDAPILEGKKLVFASILRAGNGLLEGMLDLVPSARVAHIGVYRDENGIEGVEAASVTVEVNTGERGDLKYVLVGLPDAAVKESVDRITSAISNAGFSLPVTRTTINLAPGDLRKEGPSYDLPIALAMLGASGQMKTDRFNDYLIGGELGLSGKTRGIKGGLAMALLGEAERDCKSTGLPDEAICHRALIRLAMAARAH